MSPQDLAAIWDAGHVSPALTPLVIDATRLIAAPPRNPSLKAEQSMDLTDRMHAPPARVGVAPLQSGEIVPVRPSRDTPRSTSYYIVQTILTY